MGSSGRRLLAVAVALAALVVAAPAPAASAPAAEASAPAPRASQNSDYELPQPRYLTPFPIVRIVGRVTRTGARVTLLRIKAPRDSTVTLTCAGGKRRGCPFSRKARRAPASGLVRFREVERRLRAGVVLNVSVRRGETIGKHVSFRIIRRRAPRRSDSCLFPGVSRPRECI